MATSPTPLVIVGMSGGVDSSVAACLLLEQGYRVAGLFMKNWEEDDGTEYCTAKADLADAESVCLQLDIPLHTANFASEYWDRVFEYFLAEYRAGRTPNPDVLCNREIKFKVFAEYATALGADHIATGHYARTETLPGGEKALYKALHKDKDQSYFLHAISAEQLSPCLFPIGTLEKSTVRAIAAKHGFRTHNKKDSTGICFIGERRFSDFLRRYLPAQPGPIENVDGQVLGEHAGLMYYTLGQRQGLGIGGRRDYSEAPWYVVDKNLERGTLIVAQGGTHPRLFKRGLRASAAHWINGAPAHESIQLMAKIRYRQVDQACTVYCLGEDRLEVRFDKPQRAVTPGQFVVFYQDEHCLGGATIDESSP